MFIFPWLSHNFLFLQIGSNLELSKNYTLHLVDISLLRLIWFRGSSSFLFLFSICLLNESGCISYRISHIVDFSDCILMVALKLFLYLCTFYKLIFRSRSLIRIFVRMLYRWFLFHHCRVHIIYKFPVA